MRPIGKNLRLDCLSFYGAAPSDVQDQAHDVEQTQVIEQAQDDSQDGDPNDQVDQVIPSDRKSTRLNSSHSGESRMPSSA